MSGTPTVAAGPASVSAVSPNGADRSSDGRVHGEAHGGTANDVERQVSSDVDTAQADSWHGDESGQSCDGTELGVRGDAKRYGHAGVSRHVPEPGGFRAAAPRVVEEGTRSWPAVDALDRFGQRPAANSADGQPGSQLRPARGPCGDTCHRPGCQRARLHNHPGGWKQAFR